MNIVTKYDIGQQVYFWNTPMLRRHTPWQEHKRQVPGNITGIHITANGVYYEVAISANEGHFASVAESDISLMKMEIVNRYDVFLDQFPELDEYERNELKQRISEVRQEALKRKA
jgi:hypothetical protein